MRSKITDKILSETSLEMRDQTEDYWKGRSDQYTIDKNDIETAKKSSHNKISKNAVGKVIERAKQFVK